MSDEKKIMKTLNGYTVYDEDAHRRIDSLEGSAPGLVFDTVADMEAYVAEHSAELKVGQNLYIRAVDVPDYWWDGTAVQELETKVDLSGYATQEEVDQLSEAIGDKAEKTLKSADGDSWEVAVEDGGDVVTHKTSGAAEIVAESLESATLADKVLTLTGITGTYGAVIIPDSTEISIDVPTNVAENPYFADPNGWQNPSFGWFFLRTAEGYITVHTTNYAEVYKVSADLKTWTSIGGAVANVAHNTMRVVLDNGTAIVYSDDVATYTVDGITGIGYCASSVKVLAIYGVTVIHRQSGGGEVDLSEVNNRIDTLDDRKMDKIMTSPDGTKWVLSVGNDGTVTATKYVGESIPATGITLNPTVLTFESSANQTITATLTPADSTDAVVWESSNNSVVTVSGGKVTPIANGTATITATAGSVSATCAVTVNIAAGEATTYSITRNITNAVGFDDSETIGEGSELLECYISADECTMDGATATVTMGGEDITETAWDNGVVNIAEVTGDVVVTLNAVKINYVVPTAEELTLQEYGEVLFIKGYTGTATAIEFPTEVTYGDKTYTVSDQKLMLYTFSVGTLEHIKVPDGMVTYQKNAPFISKTNKSNLKTVTGTTPSAWNGSANCEKVDIDTTETNLTSVKEFYLGCANVRTAQGMVLADTVTNMSLMFQNCKGLIDGGTVPEQITDLNGIYYGCSALRRVRIESRANTSQHNPLQGVKKTCEVEIYSDSAYYLSRRYTSGAIPYRFKGIDKQLTPVCCIGDSLTAGTDTVSYPQALTDILPVEYHVGKGGYSGGTSETIYQGMLTETREELFKNAVMIVWHGTNGYGVDGSAGVTEKMKALFGDNEKYLFIPPTAQGAGDDVYESWVATYGAEHVFSVGDWFADNGYTVADYQTDGTHFTAEGYQLIAQAIYDKLIASGFVTAAE